MAITISGQNNNDKILASDGVLDQISGFNVGGVLTTGTTAGGGSITVTVSDVLAVDLSKISSDEVCENSGCLVD